MNRLFRAISHYAIVLIVCLVLPSTTVPIAYASNIETPADTEPKKTIAYFEAGPYWEFSLIHEQIIAALKERRLLRHMTFPEGLHISPGWNAPKDELRNEARKLMTNSSIDAILSMGTEATKALLAENNDKTLIMSIDVADPVGAGIIDPQTGKGVPNLTIQYIKDKWYKVFALFHEAFPFKRLGIMYHNTPEGLSYSNVNEAQEVARERGFTLIEYPYLDKEESLESCKQGIDQLMKEGIDSFYISALNCFDWTQYNPQPMVDTLNSHNIKTFARDGSIHVRRGALMGLSTLNYTPLGRFYADNMAHRLGLLPSQDTSDKESYTPKITLNMVTASKLNMDMPLILLISADEIYDSTLADVQNATTAQ